MQDVRKKLNKNSIKQICKLYKRGESTWTLSKQFSVGHTTILYHLKKNHITLRSKSESLKIGFKFGRVKIRKHKIPSSSMKITPQKSYLLGVLCGDGFIDFSQKRRTFHVGLVAKDKEFVLKFRNAIKHIYKINSSISVLKPRNKNWSIMYQTRACSKNICLDILKYGSFKTENWKVPIEIKKSTPVCKHCFLRGFYDSEGDVDEKYHRVGLTSINSVGLKEVQNFLNELGIRNSFLEQKTYGNRKYKFILRIQDRKSLEMFCRKIGFTIERKQKALQKILKNYKIYKTLKEQIAELRPQMIILRNRGYSYKYISKKLKLPISTVWRNLNQVCSSEATMFPRDKNRISP
jgi:intein-encoded DNA endonuclease-like protein